jgi:hypothetical protein
MPAINHCGARAGAGRGSTLPTGQLPPFNPPLGGGGAVTSTDYYLCDAVVLQRELQTLSLAGASVGLDLRWWVPGAEAVGVPIASFRQAVALVRREEAKL